MAKSKQSFNKKLFADKKRKKQSEKFARKLGKKDTPPESNWENMIMYVDADGNFTKTKPVKPEEE